MGFKTKNLNSYAGYAEFGEGEETLGILVHLDVVPEGDGWDYNPYGEKFIMGDYMVEVQLMIKGPAMAVLYAMKIIKDIGVPLNKKIRIIFGTNEETGWGCMNYYLKMKIHQIWPLLQMLIFQLFMLKWEYWFSILL